MKRTLIRALLVFAISAPFGLPVMAQDQPDSGAKPEAKPEEKKKDDGQKPDQGGGDQGGNRGDRGGRGGGPGGGGGGRRGFGMIPVDRLKELLDLTPEQVQKLEDIQEEVRTRFREMRDSGGDMRSMMQEMQTKIRDKIRGILTDAQKPKFDEFVKQQDERMRNGGGPGGFGRDPAQMKKRLMDDAEKALMLSADEKAAVLPLIEKAVDARTQTRTDGDKRREEFLTFVKKTSTPEEVKAKLEEYRKARESDQEKVKTAQKALRDVLTIEQEAKLVALGILD
jgi:Spy/CpxP family protein refolding chaperone